MKLTANKIAGILRENGYKLTPQRHAVLKAIAANHDHLSPEAIYEKASDVLPGIGIVTVYRTLEILDKLDLLCRIHTDSGCHGFMMRRPTEHHHHLVCTGCGRTVDFTECNLEELERKLEKETGFKIEGHLLQLFGKCKECRSKDKD
jgi:Fur family transcriptional regulator, ferric uptake regulator